MGASSVKKLSVTLQCLCWTVSELWHQLAEAVNEDGVGEEMYRVHRAYFLLHFKAFFQLFTIYVVIIFFWIYSEVVWMPSRWRSFTYIQKGNVYVTRTVAHKTSGAGSASFLLLLPLTNEEKGSKTGNQVAQSHSVRGLLGAHFWMGRIRALILFLFILSLLGIFPPYETFLQFFYFCPCVFLGCLTFSGLSEERKKKKRLPL